MRYPYRIVSGYKWNHDPTGIEWQTMRHWLHENIGPAYILWQSELSDDRLAVKFVDERDAVLFSLRWL